MEKLKKYSIVPDRGTVMSAAGACKLGSFAHDCIRPLSYPAEDVTVDDGDVVMILGLASTQFAAFNHHGFSQMRVMTKTGNIGWLYLGELDQIS